MYIVIAILSWYHHYQHHHYYSVLLLPTLSLSSLPRMTTWTKWTLNFSCWLSSMEVTELWGLIVCKDSANSEPAHPCTFELQNTWFKVCMQVCRKLVSRDRNKHAQIHSWFGMAAFHIRKAPELWGLTKCYNNSSKSCSAVCTFLGCLKETGSIPCSQVPLQLYCIMQPRLGRSLWMYVFTYTNMHGQHFFWYKDIIMLKILMWVLGNHKTMKNILGSLLSLDIRSCRS